MPAIAKTPPTQTVHSNGNGAATAPGIVHAKALKRSWMKVLIYGRSRVGKSTLSAQWPKPLLAMACEPRENGGADSIMDMDGVDVAVGALKELSGEDTKGSAKFLGLIQWMQSVVDATGKCPYQTVTLDATALQHLILAEICGWDSLDHIIKRPKRGEVGGVGLPKYMERADQTMNLMSKLKDLPCHVIFLAQEKDHNPAKDDDGNPIGGKLVRLAQEKSFMAASLGQSTVEWLQNACQYILQLYMDSEVLETTTQVDMGGVMTPQTIVTHTGRYIRRLRTSYHANYAAGITIPGIDVVPEYIEAATPRAMYEALIRVSQGIRVAEGKYL